MKHYLVRHGESLSSDIDPNQPLSKQGKEETKRIAELLKPTHLEIDEILHSEKLRAKQTAEIIQQTLAPDLTLIQKQGLKPMDPIEPIIEEIQSFDRNVMLVGHLPFMEKLLSELVLHEEKNSLINFVGSTIVCLEGEKRQWTINWIVSPLAFMMEFQRR